MASIYRNCRRRGQKTVVILDGKEIIWDCPGRRCPCGIKTQKEEPSDAAAD